MLEVIVGDADHAPALFLYPLSPSDVRSELTGIAAVHVAFIFNAQPESWPRQVDAGHEPSLGIKNLEVDDRFRNARIHQEQACFGFLGRVNRGASEDGCLSQRAASASPVKGSCNRAKFVGSVPRFPTAAQKIRRRDELYPGKRGAEIQPRLK
jgi:hypothetical protein